MLFAKDFQTAKKEHKEIRVYAIRNKGKQMKYSPAESQVTESMFMKWHTYFQDQDILDEIEKDVKRTRTELKFFSRPIDPKLNTPENQERLKR